MLHAFTKQQREMGETDNSYVLSLGYCIQFIVTNHLVNVILILNQGLETWNNLHKMYIVILTSYMSKLRLEKCSYLQKVLQLLVQLSFEILCFFLLWVVVN